MSEKTANYQLTKLDEADISTIVDMNSNADKIDAALKMNHDEQQTHCGNKNNPHEVTKTQVGLGNVDNTADLDKPVSMAQQNALNGKADLGSDGKIPAAQLPSYVDDVLEFNSKEKFPQVGETGKIYVAIDTNLTYRWTGAIYVEISPSLALGTTSSTAYRGDWGEKNRTDIAALMTRIEKLEIGQYPVGSIFMTTDNRNPSNYLGGTWVAWGAGHVPVGVDMGDDNFNAIEKTGGSKDAIIPYHRHYKSAVVTGGQSRTHSHKYGYSLGQAAAGTVRKEAAIATSSQTYTTTDNNVDHTHTVPASYTDYAGAAGNEKGANMQPYITCYMWKRTA